MDVISVRQIIETQVEIYYNDAQEMKKHESVMYKNGWRKAQKYPNLLMVVYKISSEKVTEVPR